MKNISNQFNNYKKVIRRENEILHTTDMLFEFSIKNKRIVCLYEDHDSHCHHGEHEQQIRMLPESFQLLSRSFLLKRLCVYFATEWFFFSL